MPGAKKGSESFGKGFPFGEINILQLDWGDVYTASCMYITLMICTIENKNILCHIIYNLK